MNLKRNITQICSSLVTAGQLHILTSQSLSTYSTLYSAYSPMKTQQTPSANDDCVIWLKSSVNKLTLSGDYVVSCCLHIQELTGKLKICIVYIISAFLLCGNYTYFLVSTLKVYSQKYRLQHLFNSFIWTLDTVSVSDLICLLGVQKIHTIYPFVTYLAVVPAML